VKNRVCGWVLLLGAVSCLVSCTAGGAVTPTMRPPDSPTPAHTSTARATEQPTQRALPSATHQASPQPTETAQATLTPEEFGEMPVCADSVIVFSSRQDEQTQVMAQCPDGSGEARPVDYDEVEPQGSEMSLSFSEDRHTLVLEDTVDGISRQLIDDATITIIDTALSPDGRYAAYLFYNTEGEYSYADGLNVIDLQSDTISVILDTADSPPYPDREIMWVSWSPYDNKLLTHGGISLPMVWEITCEGDTGQCTGQRLGEVGSYTNSILPAPWSPDGGLIAYPCHTATLTGEDNDAICTMSTSGVPLREFKESELGVTELYGIAWSPESDRLAFTAFPEGESNPDIFILSLVDGSLLNLTAALPGRQYGALWVSQAP
jgi:WD40 repeat protein